MVAAVLFSVCSRPAAALTVDYNGPFVTMGSPLQIGQEGTITGSLKLGNTVLNTITGYLPENTMIEFTYTFKGKLTPATFLAGTGSYSYDVGGDYYEGMAGALANPEVSFSTGSVNGNPSAALAMVSAQITGLNTATVVIKNFSAGVLDFATLFFGTLKGSKKFEISYVVSAVPVPAALPMFGIGLMALTGYGARKKFKKQKHDA